MILGVDPGERRVGLAIADPDTRFPVPLGVVEASVAEERIAEIVAQAGVTLVVVGRPVGLGGAEGPAVQARAAFLERLRDRLDVEVVTYDERFTTVVAERALRSAGAPAPVRRRRRDAVAAQVMLQGYLDATR